MKQQVVFFQGPSTAGKSTILSLLLSERKRFFHINMDKIKWFISDYSNKNESDKIMLQSMIFSMAEIALNEGMSLFIEGQIQLVDFMVKKSREQDIDIKYVNIEAPLDVLKDRFHLRIDGAKKEGRKLGNTSEERLVEIYNNYKDNKFADGITIDTSKLSKLEALNKIEEYIGVPKYK